MKKKSIIWKEKDKIMKKQHFVANKTDIKQFVLKVQQISWLPHYIKLISRGCLF